ncbi:hypothetical protein [Spongorhabdus nitratireducens]
MKRGHQKLDDVNHKCKNPVFLGTGDFVSIANNDSLHAREVIHIGDMAAHKMRWLCKTFNVNSLQEHQHMMSDDRYGVVNE